MRIVIAALLVLASVGCASASTPDTGTDDSNVTSGPDASDAKADTAADGASDASHDAGPDVADAAPDPCRCAFHWSSQPELIRCYTRGDCKEGVRCYPVIPMTEDSGCRMEM